MDKCGFPAGTRVVTDKGLARIEDIRIGGLLLSKSENGEQVFKPVTKIVSHENMEIFKLTYATVKNTTKPNSVSDKAFLKLSAKAQVTIIRATLNHSFWVKEQGWTTLSKLQKGQLLETKDTNTLAYVFLCVPEYQTNYSDIGATYGFENEIDFNDQFIDELEPQYHLQKYDEKRDRIFLKTKESSGVKLTVEGIGEIHVMDKPLMDTTYNLEVADNHSFYRNELLVKSL